MKRTTTLSFHEECANSIEGGVRLRRGKSLVIHAPCRVLCR